MDDRQCSGSRSCCQGFVSTECKEGYKVENNKCLRVYTITVKDGVDSTVVEKTIDEDTQKLDQVMRDELLRKYQESNGLYTCEINGTDISCTCARNHFRNETKCSRYGGMASWQ